MVRWPLLLYLIAAGCSLEITVPDLGPLADHAVDQPALFEVGVDMAVPLELGPDAPGDGWVNDSSAHDGPVSELTLLDQQASDLGTITVVQMDSFGHHPLPQDRGVLATVWGGEVQPWRHCHRRRVQVRGLGWGRDDAIKPARAPGSLGL